MNDVEMATYCEPDFGIAQEIINEFIDQNMTEEEKEKRRKETADMYKNFTDDDWRDLGDCCF